MLLDKVAVDFNVAKVEPMLTEILTDEKKKVQNPTFRVCIEKGAIIEGIDGQYETVKSALYDTVICDEKEAERFLEYILAFK